MAFNFDGFSSRLKEIYVELLVPRGNYGPLIYSSCNIHIHTKASFYTCQIFLRALLRMRSQL